MSASAAELCQLCKGEHGPREEGKRFCLSCARHATLAEKIAATKPDAGLSAYARALERSTYQADNLLNVPRAMPQGTVNAKADQVEPEDVMEGFRPDMQTGLFDVR